MYQTSDVMFKVPPMSAFSNSTPADARPFRHAKLVIRPAPVPTHEDMDAARQRLALVQAQYVLEQAAEAYAEACKWLGEANRRLSPHHRGAGLWTIHLRRSWVRSAFRDINRTRAALRTARKTLAALEAV